MPVLVTGASGFVGAHVVLELLKREIPVRAMMRDVSLANMFPESNILEVTEASLHQSLLLKICPFSYFVERIAATEDV